MKEAAYGIQRRSVILSQPAFTCHIQAYCIRVYTANEEIVCAIIIQRRFTTTGGVDYQISVTTVDRGVNVSGQPTDA